MMSGLRKLLSGLSRSGLAAFLLHVSSGCTIHPLPDDVTRETTTAIVHKIQCEARDALDHITANVIRDHSLGIGKEIAAQLLRGDISPDDLLKSNYIAAMNLDKIGQRLFQVFTLSAVTFDFGFTINELNENSVDSNFRMPLTEGLFTLNLKGGAKFDRKVIRKFQISNTFYELHHLDRAFCKSIEARSGDVVYPIVGRIGLEEVFSTFIQIDGGISTTSDQAHRFTDTLTFTTTLSGGVSPKITLNPLTRRTFELADATATLKASRSDEHQVAIAIARGPEIKDFRKALIEAKLRSRLIADANRIENLLDVQRNAILSRN